MAYNSHTSNEDDLTIAPAVDAMSQSELNTLIIRSNESALPVGTILGEFEIVDIIGWGGFGIVYQAYDQTLDRQVALKEYMPSSLAFRDHDGTVSIRSDKDKATFEAGLRSFINEARILAKLQEHADHPSLVKVFRFWESHGTAYMAMPFYEGRTLKETLPAMDTAPSEEWLRALLYQLIDALTILHKENCLHRDIAPDNILILKDGRALLLDFGAARKVIRNKELTVILKHGYAPIEQYASESSTEQGPWTDIYALAAVIYFAITKEIPQSSAKRIRKDSLIPLNRRAKNQYSEKFLQLIDKALAIEPSDRPQTVHEFRSLLKATESKEHSQQKTSNKLSRKTLVGIILIVISSAIYYLSDEQTSPLSITTQPDLTKHTTLKELNLVSALEEIFDYRDRNHAVAVSVEKAQFKINKDQLNFKIHSSKPGYIYILAVDSSDSELSLFFPNEVDNKNYIAANEQIELPRCKWKLTSRGPAGTNHLIVIVSKHPRDFISTGLQQDDFFGHFPIEQLKVRYQNYSGSLPLLAGNAICTAATLSEPCSESYGAALFTLKEVNE